MKKIIGSVVGLLLLIAILYFGFQKVDRPGEQGPGGGLNASGLKGPAAGEEALYEVSIKTTQRSAEREGTVIALTGLLAQSKQGEGDFISEWREISSLILLDNPADAQMIAAILRKPMISTLQNGDPEHYLPKDFSPALLTFQLSFLNKFFVPVKPATGGQNSILRTEKDEAGTVKVQYDFTVEGENQKVLKTWDRYVQDAIKVDAADNMIRYVLTREGRAIQIDGLLTTHYREPSSIHFTTELTVKFKSSGPVKAIAVTKESLEKTDLHRAAALAQEAARPKDAISYEEAMKKLDTVTDKSDAKEVYEIFSVIKADVIANPEHAQALVDKILSTPARDEGSNRKLAVIFGVLAQSQAPEIADSLAKLATDCPDNFCKVQAMIGLNDHPNPTSHSANEMIRIAGATADDELSGTALLAAGSIAKKLQDSDAAVAKALVGTLNDPAKASIKNTVIGAMGNHGSGDYYGPLTQNLKDKDSGTRAAAVYGLRYLPNAEVNATLIQTMKSDPSVEVQREAIKAMAYRNLTREEYLAVAEQAVASPERDVQQDAARILVSAHRDDPSNTKAAVDAMLNGTKLPDIKRYIETELAPPTQGQSPPSQ